MGVSERSEGGRRMDVGEQKLNMPQRLQLAAFVAVCILLNYGGAVFARAYQLPVWLDSFGTALTAYGLGPLCGAVVGFAGNIIYGITSGASYIYAITSVVIGILIGWLRLWCPYR